MIALAGVQKSFSTPRSLGGLLRGAPRQVVKVLDGVDLEVAAGELVTIAGDNGAGKSTLLRLIAGLLVADAGTIRLGAERARAVDPATQRRDGARRCGYLPGDDRGLPQRATVAQTLQLFTALRGLPPEAGRVGPPSQSESASWAERRVAELSTGQRRRLQIACALLAPADAVLLLDEPSRGLDDAHAAALWAALRARQTEGATLIVVSHSAAERAALGGRPLRLVDGRLVDARVNDGNPGPVGDKVVAP